MADPLERLRATHEALRAAKERHKALPAQRLQDATQFIPPAAFARARGSRSRSRRRVSRSGTSSSPTSRGGSAVVPSMADYPVSVITDGMGLNMRDELPGRLDVGIVADREQMRDVWMLIDWLGESLDELLPERPRSATTGRRAAAAK